MTDDRDRQGHDEDTGKVVRLPRDWLGPREELVPIGPEPGEPERAGSAEILELSPRPGRGDSAACTQDDFWGGDLDAIPKPVIAPRPAQAAPVAPHPAQTTPVVGHHHVAPGALGLRVGRHPAMPRRRSGQRTAAPPRSPRHPLRSVATPRRFATMAGLAVAALGAIAVGAGLSGRPSPRGAPAAHTQLAGAPDIPQTLDPHPTPVSRARPLVAAPHRAQARRPHRQVSATSATFVKTYTTRTLPSTASSSSMSGAASSTPASTSAPVTIQPTVTTSTSSAAATTASTHKTRNGPTGPGAPFAPGQLG